ncbi:hypothetical protein ABZ508_26525 [Streptomyces lavendulocolor]|uniref:Uncharacterized protein n=1 Tax=Streptomyces lavendulocolor TaxID=67316 RepID=A0ABV2WC74_9ACTN
MNPRRDIPAHGTASRYRGDPRKKRWTACHCEKCLTAFRRQRKARELRVAQGLGARHALEPVLNHIHLLVESGWTLHGIEKASGVDRRGLYNIRHRLQRTVNHSTAHRLLALQPSATPRLVNAVGARRRVQALVAIGWSMSSLAPEVGLSHTALEDIANGRRVRVTTGTHEAIRAAYRSFSKKPGPSGWVRAFAARQGWHGPLAWDDIDDPAATPEALEPYTPIGPNSRDSMRIPEIRHLLAFGESPASIARQMGGSEKYIRDLITQNGLSRAA